MAGRRRTRANNTAATGSAVPVEPIATRRAKKRQAAGERLAGKLARAASAKEIADIKHDELRRVLLHVEDRQAADRGWRDLGAACDELARIYARMQRTRR